MSASPGITLDSATRSRLAQAGLTEEPERITLSNLSSADAPGDDFPGRRSSTDEEATQRLELDVLAWQSDNKVAEDLVVELRAAFVGTPRQLVLAARGVKDFAAIYDVGIQGARQYRNKALVAYFEHEDVTPLLWVSQTCGPNLNVTTAGLVAKLSEWRRSCDFDVLGAGRDWLRLRFESLPEDLPAFAAEVDELCPDILRQSLVKEVPEDFAELSPMERLRRRGELIAAQTPDDLVVSLERTRRLAFWWD